MGIAIGLFRVFCSLLKYLNMSPLPAAFKDFMYNMVKETIEYREKNNVVQKDFIQCLIQIRNSGKVNIDDSLWDSKTAADGSKAMTIEQCAGQVALLYLAGFDTTSSAVANTLYELAQNPDLMERLQRDIDDTLTKHNGIISYEAVQEITLLELCVQGNTLYTIAIYAILFRPQLQRLMEFFFSLFGLRIDTQVSNVATAESHLHRGLQNTEFGFNCAKRNANCYIVIGSTSGCKLLSGAGKIHAGTLFTRK